MGMSTKTGIVVSDIAAITTPQCPFSIIESAATKANIMDATEKKRVMRPKSNLMGQVPEEIFLSIT